MTEEEEYRTRKALENVNNGGIEAAEELVEIDDGE